ncbi:amidase family protein [Paraburkholderia sp. BL10I2N1]|uniref:amidase family protein n=1 Tax=Paraburkholderia sp. BL10I2N1 TaxID=1938796 RepID=UPI00105BC32A|nr:amidase family protein [Paraburkholderia sp. BL10I2N1]TDN67156.1 aspartyl-tRNA(Asn)/glutamyl-tRNA(Gln) amidotransferase subunit A [Paraburkholderia sp. BL10I2N1]
MSNELCDLTARELATLYQTGAASPVEAMQQVLARIHDVNPAVNAFCHVGDDALDAARASEKRWRRCAPLSLLDGVPVSIKDNVDVLGMPTRYGSRTTPAQPAQQDSPAVARLREAGVICFGKTTLPDFAHKIVTDSPLTGVTRNPWRLSCTPGGSSGGAAAAVALGIGPLAIGTDGGGSIRIPAAFTGIFGFKPSFGRVPHAPRGPFALTSHVGPMTRNVEDAARVMKVIAQPDARDWYALPFDGSDYEQGLQCSLVRDGIRIAYSPSLGLPVDVAQPVHMAVAHASEVFRELGAQVEQANPPGVDRCNAIHALLWSACCSQLADSMPDTRTLLDTSLQAYARAGSRVSRKALIGALIERGEWGAAVNAFFERYELVLCPVYPRLAMPLAELPAGDELFPYFTAWCNQLGLPAASVYGGMSDSGMPIGIQIVGGRHADALVLWASHVFEQAFGRVPLAEIFRTASAARQPGASA